MKLILKILAGYLIVCHTIIFGQTTHFSFTSSTGSNATVAILTTTNPNINGVTLVNGDEIGAFTPAGLCVGAVIWNNSNTAITVWGDNDQTGVVDGIKSGELISFKVRDQSENIEYPNVNVTFDSNPPFISTGLYSANGLYSLTSLSALPITQPTITVSATSLPDFGNVIINTSSAFKSFTVSGINLTANIVVTAPTGFQVSTNNSTFISSVSLTQSGGTVSSTTVYARFSPTSVMSYTGNITNTSTGATSKNISVSGNGTIAIIKPIITLQPISQTKTQGQTVSFRVEATCDGTLGFQWWHGETGYQWNDGDKAGRLTVVNTSNSSTLTITNVNIAEDNNNNFLCEVKNLNNYPVDSSWINTNTVTLNVISEQFTEQTSISLTGVLQNSSAWGDYDNDGDMDLLLTGSNAVDQGISKIYRNNGNNTFTEQTSIALTGVYQSSVAWGDYDNDGDLDILLTGYTGSTYVSKIYRNNGNNTFTEQTSIPLLGVYVGSVAWGDYDNDGNLDIILTGVAVGESIVSKIYRNNGDNTFTDQTTMSLTGVANSSVSWADYDNDGDLDLLLTGNGASGYSNLIAKIYRNNNTPPNTLPTSPTNLGSAINGQDVTFSWNKSTDNETSQNGLRYNLVIGTTLNGVNTLSPMSDRMTGYRRIISLGNTNHKNSWTVKGLAPGTYYWSVQAIDNAHAGSSFSAEQSFILSLQNTPNINLQPVNQSVTEGQTVSFTVEASCDGPLGFQWWNVSGGGQWNNGGKNGRLTIVNTANSSTLTITNSNVTEDNNNKFLCEVKNFNGYPADGYWINTNTVTLSVKYLTINQDSKNVGYQSGSTTFVITSNTSWSVSDDATWLTALPSNGLNIETLTVIYEENTSPIERVGTITVNGSGITRTITVTQEGAPFTLTVSPSNRPVASTAGSTTFSITSNTSWSVNDDADWITLSPTSGSSNGTLTATFTENSTVNQRVGTITVTGGGIISTVTISQDAPTPNMLSLTPSNQEVVYTAGITTFSLISNTSWTVNDDADWITVLPTSGTNNETLTATFNENTNTVQRVGTITVSGGGITRTATITQGASLIMLIVSPSNRPVAYTAGSTTFSVLSNTSWIINDDADWLVISPTNGNNHGMLTATYTENTVPSQRIGTIITITGVGVPTSVTVTQAAAPSALTVNPTDRYVVYTAGSTTFNITSNISWVVSDDADWLTVAPDSGSGIETLIATFEENPTAIQRVGTITVSGGGINSSVKVRQEGSTGIEDLKYINNVPTDYMLLNNYPNPFNPSTYIEFGIPEESTTQLKIYDIIGNEIATLLENETLHAGKYRYELKVDKLTSGIYIFVLISQSNVSQQSFRAMKKMILLK